MGSGAGGRCRPSLHTSRGSAQQGPAQISSCHAGAPRQAGGPGRGGVSPGWALWRCTPPPSCCCGWPPAPSPPHHPCSGAPAQQWLGRAAGRYCMPTAKRAHQTGRAPRTLSRHRFHSGNVPGQKSCHGQGSQLHPARPCGALQATTPPSNPTPCPWMPPRLWIQEHHCRPLPSGPPAKMENTGIMRPRAPPSCRDGSRTAGSQPAQYMAEKSDAGRAAAAHMAAWEPAARRTAGKHQGQGGCVCSRGRAGACLCQHDAGAQDDGAALCLLGRRLPLAAHLCQVVAAGGGALAECLALQLGGRQREGQGRREG